MAADGAVDVGYRPVTEDNELLRDEEVALSAERKRAVVPSAEKRKAVMPVETEKPDWLEVLCYSPRLVHLPQTLFPILKGHKTYLTL